MQVGGILRHVPAALLMVCTGLVVTVAQYPAVLRSLRLGPSLPSLVFPTGRQWARGALQPCTRRMERDAVAVQCLVPSWSHGQVLTERQFRVAVPVAAPLHMGLLFVQLCLAFSPRTFGLAVSTANRAALTLQCGRRHPARGPAAAAAHDAQLRHLREPAGRRAVPRARREPGRGFRRRRAHECGGRLAGRHALLLRRRRPRSPGDAACASRPGQDPGC